MKPRRFVLRNGITVEEAPDAFIKSFSRGGYIDDYRIVEMPEPISGCNIGSWLCLGLRDEGMPVGGEHGAGFDIVEEVK